MIGGPAISVRAKNLKTTQSQPPRKRWFVRWWAIVLWILLALIFIVFLLGCWAWTQRYALMEKRAIKILSETGIEAELDIVSISRTQAKIKDIRLSQEGEEVLKIQDINADYIWPDVRDLKFKHIEIGGASAQLRLGEDWKPTQSWIQEQLEKTSSSGSGGGIPFPENGVKLKDAVLNLSSPLGQAKFYIDADVTSKEDFTADITLAPSDLSYGGFSAQGAGVVSLEKTGQELRITGQAQTETLSNENVEVTEAYVQIDGMLNLDTFRFLGSTSVESESLSSKLFASGPMQLGWDGDIFPKDNMRATGTWIVSAKNARSPRPARAREVAETLSLFPAISVVPITEYYAPEMRDIVFGFINGSDISGQGQLDYGPEGFSVNPVGTFNVENERNQLRLRPRPDQTFYRFDKPSGQIAASMDAVFKNPVGLTLENIQLNAASDNGLRLNRVSHFSTQLTTQAEWTAVDLDNRPVRLDPLSAALDYDATKAPRRLSVTTAFNYDGELPGSYVEGLNLDGRLDVHLYEGRQVVDFTPRSESVVTLSSLETPTSWHGENIQFTLPATKNLFSRTAEQSTLTATLNAADFTLTQPGEDGGEVQVLDLRAAKMGLVGTLYPDATQDWDIAFTQGRYASETLPGPGTAASAHTANLTARLAKGQAPQITLDSPSITVETPLVRASDIEVALEGTPETYTIEHSGGLFFIQGSEMAERAKQAGLGAFPANGRVEFNEGTFTGRANLQVEKANNADVNVDYTYKEGAGTAEIDIPSILFEPKGLQPQTLVPAFQGKVARVDGEARAALKIAFADGAITNSSGIVDLVDIDVGTAPGPITGLNTRMHFTSLLPLETDGPQILSMDVFNPGFPLENGEVTYSFVPDGVQIDAADWPIGNGWFSLDPFTWVYTAEENRVTMRVRNVALGDFLQNFGNKKIEATGTVVGTFPVVVRGIEVLIEDGKIAVPDGGVIKYDPGPGIQAYSQEEAIQVLRQQRTNEYAALAQDALREFKYQELSASLDGPLNGYVEIGMVFDGSNQKVLNQQPFRFDISVRGELFNIARSFNTNARVKAEILRQNGTLPEGAILGE